MQRMEILIVGLLIGVIGLVSGLSVMGARARLRDVTRLAHVREMQMGLEFSFANRGTYPVVTTPIALGEAHTICLNANGFNPPCGENEVPYIEFVPAPPSAGLSGKASCDGVRNGYCYASDGESFRITFELEKANRQLGLPKGANCATENGITPGVCQAFTE